MNYFLRRWPQLLLFLVMFSWGATLPLSADEFPQSIQTQETLPQDQPQPHEPIVPRHDIEPSPDPEPEPLVPKARDPEGLGQPLVPQPLEPGLPLPPMPQPADPGMPPPPMPQPAEPPPLAQPPAPPDV